MDEINKHKVPFYLYLPESLRKDSFLAYTKRYGSHKDIFPTLFNLVLTDQEYFSIGNDLLSDTLSESKFYGSNLAYFIGSLDIPKEKLRNKIQIMSYLNEYYFSNDE